jgi:hypothetical protein
MMRHLKKNKVLTTLNHGFRSGYSCETQLLIIINDLLKSYNKGFFLYFKGFSAIRGTATKANKLTWQY